jgi:hypothetical protein
MQTRLALRAMLLVALLSALLAACGGDDGEGDEDAPASSGAAGELAARILRIGEPVGTAVDSEVSALVSGLQAALNPDAITAINIAVEAADERLTLIAETAGVTTEQFAASWASDRDAAFALFAGGLRIAEDPSAIRDELFLAPLVALPVHPDGALLGSGRIDRPDGTKGFFLIYDVSGATVAVEETVARQLDQSPWQVTGGQSTEDLAIVQFQSTVSADLQGIAWVQPIDASSALEAEAAAADGADGSDEAAAPLEGPFASVLYLIETEPPIAADEPDFALPVGRPLPGNFPATFLLDDSKTITQLAWNTVPGGSAYQVTILTRESAFDVADVYRDRFELEGWDLTGDDAVGFATVLQFASDDGAVQGSVSLDAFAADDTYTEIVVQVQATSRAPVN